MIKVEKAVLSQYVKVNTCMIFFQKVSLSKNEPWGVPSFFILSHMDFPTHGVSQVADSSLGKEHILTQFHLKKNWTMTQAKIVSSRKAPFWFPMFHVKSMS